MDVIQAKIKPRISFLRFNPPEPVTPAVRLNDEGSAACLYSGPEWKNKNIHVFMFNLVDV